MDPAVSVIIPCYNEQETIQKLLRAIISQTYSRSSLQVIIADGLSTDQTRVEIEKFETEFPDLDVSLVENPKRSTTSGLNLALSKAKGEFIVRLDAHCIPQNDYIERCIQALTQGKGDNVGGVWDIRPGGSGWISTSIAIAATHPLGVGDAQYRYAQQAGYVDTVPFGAFRKALIDRVGPYDETLLTNEDYELNTRIRQAGGRIWLDPAIRSIYFARSSLPALARQYRRYGFWKAQMLRRYPNTIRWRQAIPPLFVLSLICLGILSIWLPIAGWLLAVEIILYLLILLGVGLQLSLRNRDIRLLAGIPLAIATMHFCWGGGFLWNLVSQPLSK